MPVAGPGLACGSGTMRYKESWKTMIQKNPEKLFPAHGKPFKTTELQKYLDTIERIGLYALK